MRSFTLPTRSSTAVRRSTRGGWAAMVARTIGGALLLLTGAVLLVLPGPGLLLIAAGFAVLAVDHPWAARLLRRGRDRANAAWQGYRRWRQARRVPFADRFEGHRDGAPETGTPAAAVRRDDLATVDAGRR